MNNVIRPTFGRPASGEPKTAQPETFSKFSPRQVYGTGVGHFVALIRAENGAEGATRQLIVG